MMKGSLIDILFDKRGGYQDVLHSQIQTQSENKPQKTRNYQSGHKRGQSMPKHSNKVIKITQFNSSLVIGEDKLVHNSKESNSGSPQKQFNIKKVNQFKNKVMVSAQRTVELQLKNKDETQFHMKPSTVKNTFMKKSIDKGLVATRCNVSNQLSQDYQKQDDYEEEELFRNKNSYKRMKQLTDFLQMQRIEVSIMSKDTLAETNQSLKDTKGVSQSQSKKIDLISEENFHPQELASPVVVRVSSPRKSYSRHIMQQKKYQENLQRQKKEMFDLKKELNRNYAKPFCPPQNITAQAYIVYQTDLKKIKYNPKASFKQEQLDSPTDQRKMLLNSHKVIVSVNPRVSVQIASLTKIMTCILILEISKKFGLDIKIEQITVGFFEQNIGGTSANIKKGQIYTVQQLMYGLMLPSGNDASLALAVWGGRKCLNSQTPKIQQPGSSDQIQIQIPTFTKRDCYARFISQMNSKAKDLNMQRTRYANTHGLANIDNKSCPYDLSILCEHAMNNYKFRQIVSTKKYECEIKKQGQQSQLKGQQSIRNIRDLGSRLKKRDSIYDPSDGVMELEEMKDAQDINEEYNDQEEIQESGQCSDKPCSVRWQNSHLLLQGKSDLYVGIKTGITNNAGPCLSSCVEYKGRRFIIIVLNCKTMKQRFKDTQNLRKWLFTREGLKYSQKQEKEKAQI